MKKFFLLSLLILIFSGCSVSASSEMDTVIDNYNKAIQDFNDAYPNEEIPSEINKENLGDLLETEDGYEQTLIQEHGEQTESSYKLDTIYDKDKNFRGVNVVTLNNEERNSTPIGISSVSASLKAFNISTKEFINFLNNSEENELSIDYEKYSVKATKQNDLSSLSLSILKRK